MVDFRACSACGGRVDVIMVPKDLDDGRSVDVPIGACEHCGSWFNEAGVAELDRQAEATADDTEPPRLR